VIYYERIISFKLAKYLAQELGSHINEFSLLADALIGALGVVQFYRER